MATDFKSLGKNEQGALIAGAVALVLSFFTAYISVDSVKVGGISYGGGGLSAWHSYAVFGVLLVIASAAIVAVKAFAKESLPDEVPWSLVAFGASALGLILLILRPLTIGGGGGVGPGWSAYILWIAVAALTYFTFTLFQASGEKIPDLPKKDTPPTPPAA
ncbi:MAG: hypothetical protein JWR83_902 [Aeromicrobium sp.]|nr:hypothetical protein [Aeromicrobium sp.]